MVKQLTVGEVKDDAMAGIDGANVEEGASHEAQIEFESVANDGRAVKHVEDGGVEITNEKEDADDK